MQQLTSVMNESTRKFVGMRPGLIRNAETAL